MKTKLIILLVLLLGITNMAMAQNRKEGIKAKKIAFITERLQLTTEEAKLFWPLYEERAKARKELKKKMNKNKENEAKKKIEEMTDEEVLEILERVLELRQGNLDIAKEYNSKFLKVLPPKKVAKFYHIEKEFKKQKGSSRQ